MGERLSYCSHYKNLEALKSNPKYEYIQPPVGHFASSRFDLYDVIFDAGYHHGSTFFYGLRKSASNYRRSLSSDVWLPTAEWARKRRAAYERRSSGSYSFTDLAAIVMVGAKLANKARREQED